MLLILFSIQYCFFAEQENFKSFFILMIQTSLLFISYERNTPTNLIQARGIKKKRHTSRNTPVYILENRFTDCTIIHVILSTYPDLDKGSGILKVPSGLFHSLQSETCPFLIKLRSLSITCQCSSTHTVVCRVTRTAKLSSICVHFRGRIRKDIRSFKISLSSYEPKQSRFLRKLMFFHYFEQQNLST